VGLRRFRDSQALATFATAAADDFTAALGAHTRKEAVLIAAFAF